MSNVRKQVEPTFNFGNTRDFSTKDYFSTSVKLCCENGFAESICKHLSMLGCYPSGDSFRRALKNLPIIRLKDMFKQTIKKLIALARCQGKIGFKLPIAIDTHDNMFYGDKHATHVLGTQHKRGSNYAFKYLTASAVIEGQL